MTESTKRSTIWTDLAALAVILMLSPSRAEAGGGFGSVWATAVTDDSITVDWSDPSGKLKHCSSPPRYRVCIKKAGSLQGTCNNYDRETNDKPFTFTGLDADERYKIKIYTRSTKRSFGKDRNCKFRKVGTTKQETEKSSPSLAFSLLANGATDSSISVQVLYSQPGDLTSINVCYKKKWLPISLNARCQEAPPFDNPAFNASRGFITLASPSSNDTVEFGGLADCRSYKAVAYGFLTGGGFVKIGTAEIKTGGSCGLFKRASLDLIGKVLDDHDLVAQQYMAEVDWFYGPQHSPGLFYHLAERHPALFEEFEAMSEDNLDLFSEAGFLEFLLEEHAADVLAPWQDEPELRAARLDIATWLADSHPEIFAELVDERGQLYGVGAAGEYFSVDLQSGSTSREGDLDDPCGMAGVGDIGYDPSTGRAHAVSSSQLGCNWGFHVVDGTTITEALPAPAAFTSLAPLDGLWYATGPAGGVTSLWAFDPLAGLLGTFIGPTGTAAVSGLAWDEAGETLYAVTAPPGTADLVTLDPASGAATWIGSTGIEAGSLQFASDGRLFAGGVGADSGRIFTLDPQTAAASLIATTGFGDVVGLARAVDSPAAPPVETCTLDLVSGIHDCDAVEAVEVIEGILDGVAVLRLNLDESVSGYSRATFDVTYGGAPSGWTVNIGDSPSNNGFGGDSGDQSRDAEMQIVDRQMSVYASEAEGSGLLASVPDLVVKGTELTLEVGDEALAWNNRAGLADELGGPGLFALAGQSDATGPVNAEIYAAFNRTIGDPSRSGSGVTRVVIRLFGDPLSTSTVFTDGFESGNLSAWSSAAP